MALEHPGVPLPVKSLADIADGRALSVERALQIAQALARQVRRLHEKGELHGRITLANIQVQEDRRLHLSPSTRPLKFGGSYNDVEHCPPELVGTEEIVVPLDLRAARQELKRHGLDVDPRRIDVYQIAAVLCQLATGERVQMYADSPRVKAAMPAMIRTILDPALGLDSPERLKTCNALSDAIDEALSSLSRMVSAAEKNTPADGSLVTNDTTVHPAASAAPASPDRNNVTPVIERLAHFRLLELLGRGGMGEVYRAYDEQLDRMVAVKVLRRDLPAEEAFLRRFQNEADIIARLPHPNLVPLYFVGEDRGRRFYVMRLIEGQSLAQRLRSPTPLPLNETISIITQCLSALAIAHDEGLIHRDIKPANILLERSTNRAYLVDFGLARRMGDENALTTPGVVMGTVEYLAPEQARGAKQVDQRADLYSLGVAFYQMLSGELPFTADSAVGWIFQHAHEPPRPLSERAPHLPPQLIDVVNKLLAKRPENRPADCREVLQLLEPWQPAELRTQQIASELSAVLSMPPAVEVNLSPPPSPRQRIMDGVATMLRRCTPQFVEQLQSTEQHAAGAVALYQRRQRRLAGLQHEGQQVLALLDKQITAHRQAIATTKSEQTRETNEQHLAVLLSQREPLNEQMAQLDLEVARVQATLASLTSRRDQLQARLKQSQPHFASKQRPRRINTTNAIVVSVLLGIFATFTFALLREPKDVANVLPDPKSNPGTSFGTKPDPVRQRPKPVFPPETYLAQARQHFVGQQWLEARDAFSDYLQLNPVDVYRRCDLAHLNLWLDDQAAYAEQCRELAKNNQAGDLYVPTFVAGTLALGSTPGSNRSVDPTKMLRDVIKKDAQNAEAQRFLTAALYREKKWNECLQSAKRWDNEQPLSYADAMQCAFAIMARWQKGEQQLARTRLRALKTAIEKIRPETYLDWYTELPDARALETCASEGLRAAIAYREAAQLIDPIANNLKVCQVVDVFGRLYRDPPRPAPEVFRAQAYDHVIKQEWPQARRNYIFDQYESPGSRDRRRNLASISLWLNHGQEYEQRALLLARELGATQGYEKVHLIRALCLAPVKYSQDQGFSEQLNAIIAQDDQNNEAKKALSGAYYREGNWQACRQATDAWFGDDLSSYDVVVPMAFTIMAQYRMGDKEGAKDRLKDLKERAEALRPAPTYNFGWYVDVPLRDRLEGCAFDGMRAQILYREAALLVLEQPDELKLCPVIHADGTLYGDPSLAATDPQDAKVAQLVRELGGTVRVNDTVTLRDIPKDEPLPNIYRLIGINLTKCEGVTAEYTAEFAKLKSLEQVDFLHTKLSEEALANLSKLTTLKALCCGDTNATGAFLKDFEPSLKMQMVVFGGPFDPAHTPLFARFPNLQGLYLGWTSMTDAGVENLPELKYLRQLILDHTKIQGTCLATLTPQRFPLLSWLDLSSIPITDENLAKLSEKLPLIELNLSETAISDKSVPHLSKFTSLTLLKLNETALTSAGVARLQAALPKCKIEHSPAKTMPVDGTPQE